MTNLVKISIDNHVADVRLNRPEKYNALSQDMIDAIGQAIMALSKNNTVRAAGLTHVAIETSSS